MKTNFCKLILGAALLFSGMTAKAQGLQGVIVEEYTTVTAADAAFYDGAGGGTYPLAAGMKCYRVYIDMAPGHFLNSVFGSTGNVLDITSTATFWNDDNVGAEFPGETRRLDEGLAFDSWITVGRASDFSTSQAGCTAGLEQLGVPRASDTNGNLTMCNNYSGFGPADTDGHVPGVSLDVTTVGIPAAAFDAFSSEGNAFSTTGSWALLPPQQGPEHAGANRILIGQFTTAGTFSFHINVAITNPQGDVEFYTHTSSESGSTVSPFLTYPVIACTPPTMGATGSNSPICAGQTLNLNAVATGPGTITYSWTGPNGFTSTEQNASIVGATTAATGQYTVTASNGCAPDATANVNVVVNAAPAATISYAGSPYCSNAGTASVSFAGTVGGTYSSTVGLSINGSTGAVDLGASTAGPYTVTYTVAAAGGCAQFQTTASITITAAPAATISYAGSPYCSNAGTASVTFAGTAGGAYSSTASLSINGSTGAVDLGASTAGPYTVIYTVAAAGGCAQFQTSASITITAAPAATISYAGSPYCSNAGTASVTFAGTAGGAYSSTASLSINGSTGAVDLGASTAGPYTVIYTVAAAGGCAQFQTSASITITAATTYYADQDGDTFGDPATSQQACSPSAGFVANNTDNCPTTPGLVGDACNDNDPNTDTDVIQANCVCAGTPIGAPDCNGVPGGPAVAGTPCNDNDPCTVNDVYTGAFPNCGCAGTFADADADGTCDANDLCPGGPEPGTACNDNNVCTTGDVIGSNCLCAGTPDNTDTDGDGIPNCSDDCPAVTGEIGSPCNDNDVCTTGDVLNASCTCAGTLADADADGTCDANDQCPGGPEPGTACNDGNAGTELDVIQANCTCAGTPIGAPDCNGVPGGPAVAGTPCNDNDPCTVNDLYTGAFPNCGCSGTFADADADGTCDANDLCPGGPEPGTACNDNNACTTGDVIGTNCLCAGTFQDTDSDGTCDANDACPLLANLIPGDPCNDNNPGTDSDVVGANCICAGTPTGCTNNLDLVFSTDANASQTTWEIIPAAGGAPACSGGGLAPSADQSVPCCLADGCWRLRVMDSAGDGMTSNGFTGGYILQTSGSAQRILDNRNNFSTGSLSAAANAGFCLPLGANKLIFSSCDKLDWVSGQYIVASPDPAVSALWNAGTTPAEATTGYEFQIFNPNGGYVFNRFRNHATSDGFAPDNASRACHMKINNWAAAQQVPAHVLMNVRLRSRVNGVNSEWGAVCRFKIDPERAACPFTKLNDVPGNNVSCGTISAFGPGNYLYAKPVSGANKYQFRFRIPGESFETVRTSNNYILQLHWITTPLQNGQTYSVDVRASKNGGVTWCTDPAPIANAWGDICQLTIDNTPVSGGNQNILMEEAASLNMYPNPNRGDQLYLSLDAVEEGVHTVSVDITDMFGKRVSARTIAVTDGFINTVLELNGEMANGLYLVHITAGDQRFTERLVIQR